MNTLLPRTAASLLAMLLSLAAWTAAAQAQPGAAGTGEPSKTAHVDHEGFPLPAEAIARVGSARFRSRDALEVLTYTRDGKTIVAASRTGEIQLWDAADGKLRLSIGR
jgi:hypothetical protein